ncbi:MAG: delta-60 repeat domain-containing protein [Dokdonella sp.]|uniref:delta-60 repeat domain-containing protein n=1 Tax=Dokdonella sp. TaxID=2291710 RepID=UPI0025BC7508|nr:delta-60 repeat domain-containing protein [Dokdonella sp.]MBZ0222297.1 delta-60 repeat domain-containing protein [Dokdonella sp.]
MSAIHRLCLGFTSLLLTFSALAQSPPPLPDPDLQLRSPGTVYASVVLADGSMIVGGAFDEINGVPRANLAKLNADGSVNLAWHPSVDGVVNVLVADAGGHVFAGGDFQSVDGLNRMSLAKLSGTGAGAVDPDWQANANGPIRAMAMSGSGHLYVTGIFDTLGGQARQEIAKVSAAGTGTVDPDWTPSIDGLPIALVIDANGDVFVAGLFESVNDVERSLVAKLSGAGAGALDLAWNPALEGNYVQSMALGPAGSLVLAGDFWTTDGSASSYLVRLSDTGAVVSGWSPAPDGLVTDVEVDINGDVFVTGDFSTIGGQPRSQVAKLSASSGAAVGGWNAVVDVPIRILASDASGNVLIGSASGADAPNHPAWGVLSGSDGDLLMQAQALIAGWVSSIVTQADGSSIVAGRFDLANQVLRGNILRLHADGTLDPDWDPAIDGAVNTLALDASGAVYVGGDFASVDGQARERLAKLSVSGALDPVWKPQANGSVRALAVDAAGQVFAAGLFDSIGGVSRASLAKLSATGAGAVDPGWNPAPDSPVTALAADTSGNVYAGGWFSSIGGQNRNYLAKLSGSGVGAADPTWNPDPDNFVNALLLDGNGQLYVGGSFWSLGGQARNGIARLATTGTGVADALWNPDADQEVRSLALDAQGALLAGGSFTQIGGQARQQLARLSTSGSGQADPDWNPQADRAVDAIALGGNAQILVGGRFANIGASKRFGLAALPGGAPFDDVIFRNGFETGDHRLVP